MILQEMWCYSMPKIHIVRASTCWQLLQSCDYNNFVQKHQAGCANNNFVLVEMKRLELAI